MMATNGRRRNGNGTGAEDIAEAIHRMVDAMQPPVATQTRQAVGPVRVEDFLRHKPTEFSSKASPDEADAWMRKCEKIFRVMDCTDEQRLNFASYLLIDDAEHWWTGMQQQMQNRAEQVNWTNFRTRFLEKYFPDTAKQDREAEFLALQQGSMTVQEYVNKFEHLARFYSQAVTEEWRCLKFERGLRHELKRVVVPLRERQFPVLVEQAKSAEQLEKDPDPVARRQKSVAEARQMKKPYSRPTWTRPEFKCYQCGGAHLKRNYPQLTSKTGGTGFIRKCYICDQPGHYADKCPNKKDIIVRKIVAPAIEKPKATGRVFAMTSTEATQSGNLILQQCLLMGHKVLVLFDSGATHSFISDECARRLNLEKRELGCELIVSTPTSRQIAANAICVGLPIEVVGRRFKVNLICLPLEGLDMILGMDWLTSNYIVIDYGRRSVVFPEREGLKLITSQEAIKEIKGGAMYFMLIA